MTKREQRDDSASDLEAPLLQHDAQNGAAVPVTRSTTNLTDYLTDSEEVDIVTVDAATGKCSDGGGIANLAVTAVGAGMLALPKAFATVGVALGVVLFVAVCFLTYFSSQIIIRWAHRLKKNTYGELIRSEFGPTGAKILQGSIIVHVAGVMVVYSIIIADMLVGSAPHYHGVLPTCLGRHDGVWFLSRAFVVGVLIVCVVLPMLISRDLTVVARYSRLSVFMMLALAAAIAGLAGLALGQGKAAPVHVLPDMAMMGEGTPFDVTTSILTVISVGALAFTCQFNLIPVHHSLKNPELPNMLRITKLSITLCALLYITIALSGYVLFGEETEGDVLKNLTISFVKTLVPRVVAVYTINTIVAFNTFNLLVNFVLKVWAVRDNVSELAFGKPAMQLLKWEFYLLTVVLVAIAYLISIFIPSVWVLVSLVGSTACVTFSYIFPGLLVIKSDSSNACRVCAYSIVALAATMAVLAVYNTARGESEM